MHTVNADQQNPFDVVPVIILADCRTHRTDSCEREQSKCFFHRPIRL